MAIAAKEARETIYWLEFIRRSGWTTVDTQEARELTAILGASARTARRNAQET